MNTTGTSRKTRKSRCAQGNRLSASTFAVRFFRYIESEVFKNGGIFTRNDWRDAALFKVNHKRVRSALEGWKQDGEIIVVEIASHSQDKMTGRWLTTPEKLGFPKRAPNAQNGSSASPNAQNGSSVKHWEKDVFSPSPNAQNGSLGSIINTGALPLDPERAADAAPDPKPPLQQEQGLEVGAGGLRSGAATHAAVMSGANQEPRKESQNRLPKPSRHPAKPETPEETAFLDFYWSRYQTQFNKEPPLRFPRSKALNSLRWFLRNNAVRYTTLTEYLINAFDSGNVFPFRSRPFSLQEFFRHWQCFANGAIHPRPAKKTIAEMVKESRRAWADTRKKGNAIVVRQLRPLLDHTGYQLDEANPELSSDFIYQLLCVRDEARVNSKLPKPSVLMSQIIDRCMEKHVPVPTDFIQHRNNLRKEEN